MILARKNMRVTAIVCLLVLVCSIVGAVSIATVVHNLTKAWSWLRQILSAIGLIELTIKNLRSDNSGLQRDIDKLTGRIAYYNRYLSNLHSQLTQETSAMRQKESALKTARTNGETAKVNRLTGEIKRHQRRIGVIGNTISGIRSSIRSLDSQNPVEAQ